MVHLIRTTSSIRIFHIGWTSYKDIDFVIGCLDEVLSSIKDKMDTLLVSDSTDESKKRNSIVQVLEVKVFCLNNFYRELEF